jgi:hypothetical protein
VKTRARRAKKRSAPRKTQTSRAKRATEGRQTAGLLFGYNVNLPAARNVFILELEFV